MNDPAAMARLCEDLAAKAAQDPGLPVSNPTASYWQIVPHELAYHQSTTLPSRVDVAIIGSGMTGISTAYHLLQEQPRLRVTVLEARSLTSGATGRNGGHCKEVPYVDYAGLKTKYGTEAAKKIVRFRLAQLDAMLETAKDLGPKLLDASELRCVDSLDVYYDREVFDRMKLRLADYLADFPEQRDRWLAYEGEDLDDRLGTVNAVGCMTGPAGALWPYRFVGGVTSHLADAERYPNLTLEANTPIESIVPSGLSEHPFRVRTRRGEIDAQYIIHCTNGHAGHLLPGLRGKVYPMRGQMTRQSAPAAFPRLGDQRSWILHYSPGYDYMTQAPSPSGDIYIGGGLLRALLSRDTPLEDADVGNVRDDQQSPGALKALETVIEERFRDGNGTAILDTWTGVMGFTVDDAPIIGKVPPSISGRDVGLSNGGEWVAAGFCGHGMAYCWLTGKAVADMLLKGQDSVKGWFPTEQYACSKERFQNSNLVEALAAFLETVA